MQVTGEEYQGRQVVERIVIVDQFSLGIVSLINRASASQANVNFSKVIPRCLLVNATFRSTESRRFALIVFVCLSPVLFYLA